MFLFCPPPHAFLSRSCSASNWAVSGVQVEPIWIPCGCDHCGCLWHSHTSHFQTIYNIFLPSVTLVLQSLCHLHTPLQFAVNNTTTDMQDQMEGRINIVIKSFWVNAAWYIMCITFGRPGMLCNSCFKISLYSVHLAQHQIMILKCMHHWDQCYWHWNLLYPWIGGWAEIAVVVCVRLTVCDCLCVCDFPHLLKSGREWSVYWKIMQMQLEEIQDGRKLRPEKDKYKYKGSK